MAHLWSDFMPSLLSRQPTLREANDGDKMCLGLAGGMLDSWE